MALLDIAWGLLVMAAVLHAVPPNRNTQDPGPHVILPIDGGNKDITVNLDLRTLLNIMDRSGSQRRRVVESDTRRRNRMLQVPFPGVFPNIFHRPFLLPFRNFASGPFPSLFH